MNMKEYKQSINPYGIAYSELTIGKRVIVDIPIDHEGNCAEVEGVISKDLWLGSPNAVYSQIRMVKQNTHKNEILLNGGLYAIYPEKVKQIVY